MNKLLSILTLLILWLPLNGQPLTLNDAVNSALEKQPGIRAARYGTLAAGSAVKSSVANFTPKISSSVRFIRLNDPIVLDLNPIRDAMIQLQGMNAVNFADLSSVLQTGVPLTDAQKAAVLQQATSQLDAALPSFSETVKDRTYLSGQVTMMQPLWTWGKIYSAYRISRLDKRIADQKLSAKEQQIVAKVADAYFLNQLLEAVVQVRKENVKSLEIHLHHAKRMYEEGLIAKVEYLRSSTALAEARSQLRKTENDLRVMHDYLTSLIYTSYDSLSYSLQFPARLPEIDSLIITARHRQPYLNILNSTAEKLLRKKRIDMADALPQIYGFASYELFKDDLSVLEPEWSVGIGLKWNMFHGLENFHKIKEDNYLRRQVELTAAETEDNLKIGIRKTYAEMVNSKYNYRNLEETYRLANENLRLNEKKFNTGLGTSLEVIDAQLTLQKVQIARLREIYTYNKKLAELLYLSGRVNEILNYYQ